jgi:ribosomal protein L31E
MATLERIYTIPLGDAYEAVRNKRGKRAIALIRAFALRHMKAAGAKISEGVNSLVLRDSIQKPPRRIKVRIAKGDDSVAKVWLIGEEEKAKENAEKRKKEEEERKKKAEEAKKKAEQKMAKPEAQKQPEKKQAAEAAKAAPPKP